MNVPRGVVALALCLAFAGCATIKQSAVDTLGDALAASGTNALNQYAERDIPEAFPII